MRIALLRLPRETRSLRARYTTFVGPNLGEGCGPVSGTQY
jgi:hypothetical protein